MEVALKEIADQKLSYELIDSDEKASKSRRRPRRT
jgi:DNA-directed RNA polymerase subunit K/omega